MPRLHPMVASTLLMVALVGITAIVGSRLLPPQPIELGITLLENHPLPETKTESFSLTLRLEIHNPSAQAQTLDAQESCLLHWLLISPAGRLLQAGKSQKCAPLALIERLEPYEKQYEDITLLLKSRGIKKGETHFLRMRIGGLEAQIAFPL